jgi:hypothetical protein
MPGYVSRFLTSMFKGFLRREEPLSPPDDMKSLWQFGAFYYDRCPSVLLDVAREEQKRYGPKSQPA